MIILMWDEIAGETNTEQYDEPTTVSIAPDSPDTAIEEFLRKSHGDATCCDTSADDMSWSLTKIARTPKTATVEWKSTRGHLAVDTIIWD